MSLRRKIIDRTLQFLTWLASGLSAWILIAIFVFIFSRGWSTLSWDMLVSDYKAESIMAEFTEHEPKSFERPEDLGENSYFSEKYGFALEDGIDSDKHQIQVITYVDDDSPVKSAKITTAGASQGNDTELKVGMSVKKIQYLDADGKKKTAGILRRMDSAKTIETLDTEAASLVDYYAQNMGGGIRGSLIATLILIGVTLLIALPFGISAAVYMQEVAVDNKVNRLMRSSIELLAGVPSIIFSLMGITMLYPVVELFGVSGQSILLGALTMAVVLLPVIIRQTEVALMNVPNHYRMASLALGATRTQTIFKVVLPNALPGILSATLLSISRIIGESAALIFTMGTAITDTPAVGSQATSLAVHIWSVMGGEQPNFELASAISIVILVIVLALNLIVKVITYQITKDKEETENKKKKKKQKQKVAEQQKLQLNEG